MIDQIAKKTPGGWIETAVCTCDDVSPICKRRRTKVRSCCHTHLSRAADALRSLLRKKMDSHPFHSVLL